jgi:hypoxanthine phosphoribosyltransferase
VQAQEKLIKVIDEQAVASRIAELKAEIRATYGNEPMTAVCVLRGAFMFFSDLVRDLGVPLNVDFVRLASYGDSTSRGDNLVFSKDLEAPIRGRHVLIVEDIVDTGHSMDFLIRTFRERSPASLRLAALVDKHERREIELAVDFPGFSLKQGFLVGYGMDYAEKYRELGAIYELRQE